tara:strand:+ start:5429 stop:6142 length:714 start_codon:yes stop_codon:yes gene_type:complete
MIDLKRFTKDFMLDIVKTKETNKEKNTIDFINFEKIICLEKKENIDLSLGKLISEMKQTDKPLLALEISGRFEPTINNHYMLTINLIKVATLNDGYNSNVIELEEVNQYIKGLMNYIENKDLSISKENIVPPKLIEKALGIDNEGNCLKKRSHPYIQIKKEIELPSVEEVEKILAETILLKKLDQEVSLTEENSYLIKLLMNNKDMLNNEELFSMLEVKENKITQETSELVELTFGV